MSTQLAPRVRLLDFYRPRQLSHQPLRLSRLRHFHHRFPRQDIRHRHVIALIINRLNYPNITQAIQIIIIRIRIKIFSITRMLHHIITVIIKSMVNINNNNNHKAITIIIKVTITAIAQSVYIQALCHLIHRRRCRLVPANAHYRLKIIM